MKLRLRHSSAHARLPNGGGFLRHRTQAMRRIREAVIMTAHLINLRIFGEIERLMIVLDSARGEL